MKFLNFNRVLCLSPHPDDVEYSMSGTIMKYDDTIFDIICLSHGTSTDTSSTAHRINEVRNFWSTIDIKNINLIFPTDVLFLDSIGTAQLITYIEDIKKDQKYDALIVPSYIDSHFEHQLISSIAMGIARNTILSVIEYKTSSTLYEWAPDLFVDITKCFVRKIDALRSCFASQLDSYYFKQENLKLFHQDFISNKKEIADRELFKIKILYD